MKKTILLALVLIFSIGQIQPSFAYENLSGWLATDDNPMRDTQNEIAKEFEPGAIGNGRPLVKLLREGISGIPKLEIKDKNHIASIHAKLRESTEIAIWLYLSHQADVPVKHQERAEKTLQEMFQFKQNLSSKLHLFNMVVEDSENYLLGFNHEGTVGLSIELIDILYTMSPSLLGQYIFHESIPEHFKIPHSDGEEVDREDHRVVYNEIQVPIFDENDVRRLGQIFRSLINNPENIPARVEVGQKFQRAKEAASEHLRPKSIEELEKIYMVRRAMLLRTASAKSAKQDVPDEQGIAAQILSLIGEAPSNTLVVVGIDTDGIESAQVNKIIRGLRDLSAPNVKVIARASLRDLTQEVQRNLIEKPHAKAIIVVSEDNADKVKADISRRDALIIPVKREFKHLSMKELEKIYKAQRATMQNALFFSDDGIAYRAEQFKYALVKLLQEHPNVDFGVAIDTDIGGIEQAGDIAALWKVIDQLENMTDEKGSKTFPKLHGIRGSASDGTLMQRIKETLTENPDITFDANNLFLAVKQTNIDTNIFDSLKGAAWITGIDDSNAGQEIYIPVLESITLTLMAALNADLESIKSFYDSIAENPITLEDLSNMIENRIFAILPKMIRQTQNLRELYERVRNIYLAA